MTRLPTIRPLLVPVLIGALTPIEAAAQAPVTLTRWSGPASLASSRAPGESLFLLRASARWSPQAPDDRGRYAVQVTLPDGRVDRRPLQPNEGPRSPRITFAIPADSVRNLLPEAVRIQATLVDPTTGALLSNPMIAGIAQFPNPGPPPSRQPTGPFDWGRPIDPRGSVAQQLPRPGPDGLRFVRVASTTNRPAFFIAKTEASNRQVSDRLPEHDPGAGRSDEFSLDAPEQPAMNLTPEQSESYLSALRQADPGGVPYRLPTRGEWEVAARAGRESAFWWGDAPVFPDGANFLGPEPGEPTDTTVAAVGLTGAYINNPWGLSHTFGNVAEWATVGENGSTYTRMGGHFRTEPAGALEPPIVEDPTALGPDPYIGVRPAFSLDAQAGAELIRRQLADDPELADVVVSFDPDRASATLTGTVPDPASRKRASDRLRSLWFLAAVVDELAIPTADPARLASIGPVSGPPTQSRLLGRRIIRVPVSITWNGPQPVTGSDWWLNVFSPTGASWAYRLDPGEPGKPTLLAAIPAELIGPDRTVQIALSLGVPASSRVDPGIVSDVEVLSLAGD